MHMPYAELYEHVGMLYVRTTELELRYRSHYLNCTTLCSKTCNTVLLQLEC